MVEFEDLVKEISADKECVRWKQPGWCRMWSDKALDLFDGMGLIEGESAMPMECEPSPGYFHTFVMFESGGQKWVLNGVACVGFEEYFGDLEQAPEPARKAWVDSWIVEARNSLVN